MSKLSTGTSIQYVKAQHLGSGTNQLSIACVYRYPDNVKVVQEDASPFHA